MRSYLHHSEGLITGFKVVPQARKPTKCSQVHKITDFQGAKPLCAAFTQSATLLSPPKSRSSSSSPPVSKSSMGWSFKSLVASSPFSDSYLYACLSRNLWENENIDFNVYKHGFHLTKQFSARSSNFLSVGWPVTLFVKFSLIVIFFF